MDTYNRVKRQIDKVMHTTAERRHAQQQKAAEERVAGIKEKQRKARERIKQQLVKHWKAVPYVKFD